MEFYFHVIKKYDTFKYDPKSNEILLKLILVVRNCVVAFHRCIKMS